MNRRILILSFVLITIGLLGLTAIQLVWLKNSIRAQEQAFNTAVFQSLEDIALHIKDIEYQPLFKKYLNQNAPFFISKNGEGHFVVSQADGSKHLYKPDGTLDTIIAAGEVIEDSTGIDTLGESSKDIYVSPQPEPVSDQEIAQPVDEDVKDLMEQMELQKEDVINMMQQELLNPLPITELIDTSKLEKLVAYILKSHGIETAYQYAISEFQPNNFVLASPKASLHDLFLSPFRAKLMQRTFFDSEKNFIFFFPEKEKYLLNTLLFQMLSSAFFLIIVVIAFFSTIHIIFRQKYLSDMKTDFINNMTHELKTPIATISLASEMLRDNQIGGDENNRKRYANIISDENKRLGDHVEKVLQIARLEKGELQLNKTDVDIHQLIKTVVHNFIIQVNERDGTLSQNLMAKDSIYQVDEMHFTNVIANLFDNALKYNDKVPEISIMTEDAPGGMNIRISDNGIGLSKDDQKKVFEKFYRVTKGDIHDTQGFGLGLSYVKSIIEKHDGRIFVQSKLKEGTTFTIFIPKTNQI